VPTQLGQESGASADLEERVQAILATAGLTLYQVSQRSTRLYGRGSPYFIPHNLYYDLRTATFSPSIYQFLALSRISGYLLADWLRVFGIDLEDIPRLQVQLPSHRTSLLDTTLVDPNAWVPWFHNRTANTSEPAMAPMGQLLEWSEPRRLHVVAGLGTRGFLYAKIGDEDALAFPDLLPGSIVRVNPEITSQRVLHANASSNRLFLVEHDRGLFCCRLILVGDAIIAPVSAQLSYAQIELRIPHEAELLGVVDAEVRPLLNARPAVVPETLAKRWKPQRLSRPEKIGLLLHRSRITMNLTLRAVAAASRTIADLLGDGRYFVSPSSLCDYEALNTPPRHVQKIVTLCSIYGLGFHTFLKAIGVDRVGTGNRPMPDHLVPRVRHGESLGSGDDSLGGGFLQQVMDRLEEVPWFLRSSIEPLSSLKDPSLDDFFWIGGKQEALYPYLENGLIALVNRRRKRPSYFTAKPLWQQPVYVLLKRDGTYLCACCGLENGNVVVHPYSQRFWRPEQFRYHQDVEVVGQIVLIARKLA